MNKTKRMTQRLLREKKTILSTCPVLSKQEMEILALALDAYYHCSKFMEEDMGYDGEMLHYIKETTRLDVSIALQEYDARTLEMKLQNADDNLIKSRQLQAKVYTWNDDVFDDIVYRVALAISCERDVYKFAAYKQSENRDVRHSDFYTTTVMTVGEFLKLCDLLGVPSDDQW